MVRILMLFMVMQDTLYLSEEKAYQMATLRSPLVQASNFGVLSAYYNKRAQFSSFLPQLSVSGTYTRLSLQQTMKTFMLDSLVMTPSGAFVPMGHYVEIPFSQKDNYDLGLTIQQTIFTFGKLLFAYKSADWKLKGERVKDSITRGYMGITVRELYTQAQLAEAYYDLMVKIDSELKEVYELAKEKYESGTATEIEYLQAKLAYTSQKSNILSARNAVNSAVSMLKVMLGIDPDVLVVLTDSIKPLTIDFDTVKSEFMDLKQMEYTIKSLNYQRKVLDRLTLPTVFSAFSYKYQKPFGMEDDWKDYWALTVGLQWNVFDGLKSINQAKSVKNSIKQLRVIYDMKKKQRITELMLKKEELEAAEEAYSVAVENTELASTLYNASKKQYEEGYLTYSDFSNIIINYHTSLVNRLKALSDLKIKQLEYLKYLKGYILESTQTQQGGMQESQSSAANRGGQPSKSNRNSMKKGGF